jgi:hypothetical protein
LKKNENFGFEEERVERCIRIRSVWERKGRLNEKIIIMLSKGQRFLLLL